MGLTPGHKRSFLIAPQGNAANHGNSKRAKIAKAGATLLGLQRSQDFSYKITRPAFLGSLRSREDKDGPFISHSAFPMEPSTRAPRRRSRDMHGRVPSNCEGGQNSSIHDDILSRGVERPGLRILTNNRTEICNGLMILAQHVMLRSRGANTRRRQCDGLGPRRKWLISGSFQMDSSIVELAATGAELSRNVEEQSCNSNQSFLREVAI